MAEHSLHRRILKTDSGRLALGLLVVIALGLSALPSVERFFLIRAGDQGLATLRLSVEGLRGALQRFEPLPGLIGERPVLAELLAEPGDDALQAEVNEQLRITADELGASDIYLLDSGGLTIAASNYLKERSFLGRRFAFRPYFTQAIAGGIGRYFALGTTSLERGYFYAAPVLNNGQIVGALTLKFTVDAFEDAWRGGSSDIIVSDLNDIVFMSSREDWHFRTLSDLSRRSWRRSPTPSNIRSTSWCRWTTRAID
jgi:two-component system C4-dicarboxylate transport sensor histidine kinase DctB